jgi:PST family polysaccharide transporter
MTAYDVSGGFVAVLSLMLLFKSTDFVRSWFESQMQSRVTVLAEFGVFIVTSAARIYMLLNGASLNAFVNLLVVEAAILSLVFLVVFYRYSGMRLTRRFSWPQTRQLIRDGFPLMLAGLSIALYMRIDQVMLGVMVNEQAVGIYAAAVRISELWYFVPMAIAASTLPALVDRRQNNPAAFRQLMKMLYRLMWALSLSAVVFIYLFGDFLVTLLFGAAYNQSAAILVIHIWAGIFVALGVTRGNWLVAENLQNYAALFTICGCAVNIIGNFYLIPTYETVGAAWATVISNAVVVFFVPLMFKKTRKMVYEVAWPF